MKIVNTLRMHKRAPTLLFGVLFKIFCPCCLLFRPVWMLNDGRPELETSPEQADGQDSPVCRGNLLDKRHYRYEKGNDGTFRLTSDQSGPCRLYWYTTERTVSCLDSLHYAKQLADNASSNSPLHFMFMGDSRIRQQFLNFVKLIPDYDQKRQPIRNTKKFKGEMEITSNILRLRLSFKWRNLINDNVTDTIRRLANSDPPERPHLLFLSIVVHHMLGINGASHQLYEKDFKKFAPELGRLANVTRVIWLNQYPIFEIPGKISVYMKYIYSEKVHNYNKAVRRLLESENSGIRIWDSSNPVAEEYVRSCAVLRRREIVHVDDRPYLFKDSSFADCDDYIHTGYSALSQATNLLYNDICNNVMTFFYPCVTNGGLEEMA